MPQPVAAGGSSSQVEKAIRFATGGGHYSADDITVTGCGGDQPFLVQTDTAAFIVAPAVIGNPGRTVTTAEVAGMEIPNESSDMVLEGLETICEFLDTYEDI